MFSQAQKASKIRDEAVQEVVTAIQVESEVQTTTINRQFKAICLLIIETSGDEVLQKLDPETRKRCESLSVHEAPKDQTQGEGQ